MVGRVTGYGCCDLRGAIVVFDDKSSVGRVQVTVTGEGYLLRWVAVQIGRVSWKCQLVTRVGDTHKRRRESSVNVGYEADCTMCVHPSNT